jgi:hypothetical protein
MTSCGYDEGPPIPFAVEGTAADGSSVTGDHLTGAADDDQRKGRPERPHSARTRCTVAYVLPVFNEADGIDAFHRALVAATGTRRDVDFEFIYVNDGSRDESLGHLLELRRRDTAPLCAA